MSSTTGLKSSDQIASLRPQRYLAFEGSPEYSEGESGSGKASALSASIKVRTCSASSVFSAPRDFFFLAAAQLSTSAVSESKCSAACSCVGGQRGESSAVGGGHRRRRAATTRRRTSTCGFISPSIFPMLSRSTGMYTARSESVCNPVPCIRIICLYSVLLPAERGGKK